MFKNSLRRSVAVFALATLAPLAAGAQVQLNPYPQGTPPEAAHTLAEPEAPMMPVVVEPPSATDQPVAEPEPAAEAAPTPIQPLLPPAAQVEPIPETPEPETAAPAPVVESEAVVQQPVSGNAPTVDEQNAILARALQLQAAQQQPIVAPVPAPTPAPIAGPVVAIEPPPVMEAPTEMPAPIVAQEVAPVTPVMPSPEQLLAPQDVQQMPQQDVQQQPVPLPAPQEMHKQSPQEILEKLKEQKARKAAEQAPEELPTPVTQQEPMPQAEPQQITPEFDRAPPPPQEKLAPLSAERHDVPLDESFAPPQDTLQQQEHMQQETPQEISQAQKEFVPAEEEVSRSNDGASEHYDAPVYAAPETPAPAENVIAPEGETRHWEATEGRSMKEILAAWSQDSDTQLIWDTDNEFGVLQNLSMDGTYENAVEALLAQYVQNDVRPYGSLHIDPQDGTRVLVVQSSQKP